MENIRIEEKFKDYNEYSINENLVILFEIISTKAVEHSKLSIWIFLLVFIISMTVFDDFDIKNGVSLRPLKKYIRDCKKLILYNRIRLYNKNPFLSICLPVLNMEKVIERSLFSIINQSFQDFEIIIVNDASEDDTENIIKRIQSIYPRIKLLIHEKAFGVYRSRFEAILNSKGEYILLMDPDDMYLNENLFYKLFSYYINYNIDIVEFSVYKQNDGNNKIYLPKTDYETHYHKFNKEIIYQPELSNILYYNPSTKEYSRTICRNIWSKMIKKKVFIKTKKYIGKKYYKLKLIILYIFFRK